MSQEKIIYASSIGAIASVVFVTAITIWAELSVPLKESLKAFSGHHWTTKSIFSIVVFLGVALLLALVLKKPSSETLRRSLEALVVSICVGTIVLIGFFTAHFFGVL